MRARAPQESQAKTPLIWPKWRLDLMERLWGDGYILPGGDAFIDKLAKTLTIGNSASVLYVGAGLGRPAQRISEVFGSFVDGIDPDPELAAIGAARAVRHDGIARVKISARPFDSANEMGRRYDALIAQEILLESTDRPKLLATFASALKPGGKLLLTDFIAAKGGDADTLAGWVRRDLAHEVPLTEAECKASLRKAGLKVRVFEDMSDAYVLMILEGWKRFEEILREHRPETAVMRGMLLEAERWTRRVQLLRNGDIRYVRVFGTTRSPDR